MSLEKTDTIAAIATPLGVGSIAIVRVSGPEALVIAKKLIKKDLLPRKAHLRSIYTLDNTLIDQGILIYFQAPYSFTGEDIVEFQCHGGVVVAKMILDALIKAGARLAEPGEFSKRAFINGKIDLSEAEAIAKIIEAKSEDAAKILARQLKGELKEFVEDIRQKLIRILAYVEVNIDYAEEDLPQNLQEQMVAQLHEIQKLLAKTVASSKRREGLIEGFKVAIIGKPNTGKSSLLNALLSYERAIVSDIAGTTRDTIEESVRIGSHLVRFVDTAGIREAKDEIEKIGIERSIAAIEESDIVIAMFDASKPLDDEDEKILELLSKYREKKDIIVVLNKIDRGVVVQIQDWPTLQLSVKDDISTLVEHLQEILDNYANTEEILLISKRQIDAVDNALQEIEAALTPLQMGELEIFAFHINEALRHIGSITRPMQSSELLDKMFGEFCLGK